jgi:hypothetical protein
VPRVDAVHRLIRERAGASDGWAPDLSPRTSRTIEDFAGSDRIGLILAAAAGGHPTAKGGRQAWLTSSLQAAPVAACATTSSIGGISSLCSIPGAIRQTTEQGHRNGHHQRRRARAAHDRPFVNCFDATTFGRTVHLTTDEERGLRNVLAALRDYGFILEASFEPPAPATAMPTWPTTSGRPSARRSPMPR